MTFVHPAAWFWVLLAVPLAVLCLRRQQSRCVTVAAGFLWEQVLAAHPSRGRWLRWRKATSLAVELGLLVLLVAAMAEPANGASWWRYLAASAVAALTLQWCLFQRRWLC